MLYRYCQLITRYLLLFCIILLSGCDTNQPEKMLENYSNRVGNSLDSDSTLKLSTPMDIPPYPRRRERFMPVADVRQGLVEVFNLRHCKLIQLVAERNSSMGKVMPPSRQVVYEIDIYIGLRDCLKQLKMLNSDPELIRQVEGILKIKDQNLEAALWNGIYTSEAYERNFSRSEPALSLNEDNGFSQTRTAIEVLTEIASLNHSPRDWYRPARLDQLENHYKSLYSHRYGSRWLRSVWLLTRTLDHTATMIEQRLQRRPVCFNNKATPKALIIKNVFMKYYAQEVQPYMAIVDRQGQEWLKLNRTLLGHFSTIPSSMRDYSDMILADNAPLWQNYLSARNRHTKAWQNLLGQCGLMPNRQQS